MKLLLALVAAVCIAGVCAGVPTDLGRIHEQECGKLHNVDPEEMKHMKPDPNYVVTRDMQCYGACIMKKSNLLGDDGKYTENFKKETEILTKCPPRYETDECETVGHLMKCLLRPELKQKNEE